MAKVLRVAFPEKCIGCELCVMETQRQLGKIGLDGANVRIFKNSDDRSIFGTITYEIHVDGDINSQNINKIKEICPTGVFTIEEKDKKHGNDLLG